MQHIAGTKICLHSRTFSRKQACHIKKMSQKHVFTTCALLCADLNTNDMLHCLILYNVFRPAQHLQLVGFSTVTTSQLFQIYDTSV